MGEQTETVGVTRGTGGVTLRIQLSVGRLVLGTKPKGAPAQVGRAGFVLAHGEGSNLSTGSEALGRVVVDEGKAHLALSAVSVVDS